MFKWLLTALTIFVASALVVSFAVTRDGTVITPIGEGTITIGNKTFEAFSDDANFCSALKASHDS